MKFLHSMRSTRQDERVRRDITYNFFVTQTNELNSPLSANMFIHNLRFNWLVLQWCFGTLNLLSHVYIFRIIMNAFLSIN